MQLSLLVDSGEFWDRLRADLQSARTRALVQTFSFEGDRTGTALARALDRCPAADRRLLVDGYSLLYHNDRLIPGTAWLERAFRREVFLTHRWARRLRDRGVGVRFGNPLGPSPLRLVRRNHKKLIVIDERVAYIGGINFSDHNFDWHDVMLRIESDDLGSVLAGDFDAGWQGRPRPADLTLDRLRLLSLSGRDNARVLAPLLAEMGSARRTIDVVSAYLSHPFTGFLADASARGVRVRILTPGRNNKANLARHVLQVAARYGFEVHRYDGGMSHLKAMIIDDELLVLGSSNFDFMSYHILEELVLMTRDPTLLRDFRERVWKPDLAAASQATRLSTLGTRLGDAAVRIGAGIAGLLSNKRGKNPCAIPPLAC
jgi:cardiolipin synthase